MRDKLRNTSRHPSLGGEQVTWPSPSRLPPAHVSSATPLWCMGTFHPSSNPPTCRPALRAPLQLPLPQKTEPA